MRMTFKIEILKMKVKMSFRDCGRCTPPIRKKEDAESVTGEAQERSRQKALLESEKTILRVTQNRVNYKIEGHVQELHGGAHFTCGKVSEGARKSRVNVKFLLIGNFLSCSFL